MSVWIMITVLNLDLNGGQLNGFLQRAREFAVDN
jgi:hypothetical protein